MNEKERNEFDIISKSYLIATVCFFASGLVLTVFIGIPLSIWDVPHWGLISYRFYDFRSNIPCNDIAAMGFMFMICAGTCLFAFTTYQGARETETISFRVLLHILAVPFMLLPIYVLLYGFKIISWKIFVGSNGVFIITP